MQSHARLTTAAAARISLPLGDCRMIADETGLDITVEATSLDGLARLEDVVAEHLLRFAFREGVSKLAWTRAWAAGRIDPPALRVGVGRAGPSPA